jgi:hypothetical protein
MTISTAVYRLSGTTDRFRFVLADDGGDENKKRTEPTWRARMAGRRQPVRTERSVRRAGVCGVAGRIDRLCDRPHSIAPSVGDGRTRHSYACVGRVSRSAHLDESLL